MDAKPITRFRSSVASALLGSIALALVTLVGFRLHADVTTTALLFLLIVVMVSLRGEPVASAWVIGLALLALNYFFIPPILAFLPIDAPLDIVALLTFLLTAVVINRLILKMRRSLGEVEQAEDAFRKQALLLDLTHDTVFVRDMDDAITYWNRGAEELYGWSRAEAVGKVSHQLTQTIFPAPLGDINDTLLRTGRWEGELVHAKRDGTRVVVASRWSLQRDQAGRPAAILETNNDVTERKRAEADLRESEEQWKAVFQNNPTMYFMVDAAGTILSVNPFGAEQLGYTVEELVDRPVLSLFLDADREEVQRTVALCFDQQGHTMRWEFRKVRKDGTLLWVRETAKVMRIKSRPVALIVCEDITERKRAQRALRRAREDALEAQFAAVLEERTRLAREMHDTLLQGFTGIGLKLVAAVNRVSGPPEATAALHGVIMEAQKILTEARRAVWGLRAGTLTGADFSAALRTAIEDSVRGTTLELEWDVRGPPRPVDPDIQAVVVRVAQEAVTNVIKHAGARMVRVRLSFGTSRVRLSVIDNGRGFTVESDPQAYRGHWGLMGMRERASQVRGKLSLRSTPGHGCEVVLLVPYRRAVVDPGR